MFAAMLWYETCKAILFPKLSGWQSHSMTICIATLGGALFGNIMHQRSAVAHNELAKAHAIIERELEERRGLRDLMELLQTISFGELESVLCFHLERLLPGTEGAVYLLSASRDVVELVGGWGPASGIAREIESGSCWALRLGKAYGSNDGAGVPCQHMGEHKGGRWCFPMLAEGETLGVFHIRFNESSAATANAQQQSAARMAERIAITLANLRLRETLRNQSIRDALTGVFNRRYMEESLSREIKRAARLGNPIAVVVLDLDQFKRLNDTYGHAVGDELLSIFGRFLAAHIRAEDIVCRYGGEEFVLIFPDVTLAEAARRTDSLRRSWSETTVSNRIGGRASTTFSAGVAAFPSDGAISEALIRAADKALYRAKSGGRDRVVTASGEEAVASQNELPPASSIDDRPELVGIGSSSPAIERVI